MSNARNYEKLNKLLKDLKLANDELVQFNYSVSHDLRQPLATISGYVNILQEIFKGKIEKSPESYIEEIIKASERMDEMIEGLLKYSKIGKEPNYEVIDLNDALSQAISNLQSLISSTGTQIENEKLPKVKANLIGMTILFQNLIDKSQFWWHIRNNSKT
ncbi:MAG: histidine kinase dimerization/phospho-acceptor domain-containing protein [Candidatus Lokiarchaeota archaeon]